MSTITLGVVDDHQLFLKSLSLLIGTFDNFNIIVEALNGKDLIEKVTANSIHPDILLVDVNMPVMDGEATVLYISEHFPDIKTVALSMKDDDMTILKMIKAGCCAYLLKDIHPHELEKALVEIYNKGYYNADRSNINYRRLLQSAKKEESIALSTKEKQFLTYASSDLTYKQIAAEMIVSERTVDGYREILFQKFNVQSRVGMVLEGVRRNLVIL